MGTNEHQLAHKDAPERTCILTRRAAPKPSLVRLALGPDGDVLPDVRAKAPGRGAYIGVSRAELDAAQANGKLKGALSRAFKTGNIRLPEDLGQLVEAALTRAALDRLGLEARGGMLITGAEKVETACRKGEVRRLFHAADAGEDGVRSLAQAWRMGGSEEFGLDRGVVLPFDRTTLSVALGRSNAVHIALTDAGAAKRVDAALLRLKTFLDGDAGVNGDNSPDPTPSADDMKTKEFK
ncbi:DUF448 domain-containing protein [Sphingomicrobium sediminis]|uniref:DUF448 domain-containing protein n=1 Tax=Sphingomicrobium sediminis TaxID=2950949 RepID=A0A9X2EE71_9SPHN|nr:DUF448 domain-containing protein [Sphingomicrobium sediminis]MCM8556293.1 DUF448 domain-containing protein [Sphingomicrobium sediminis]